MSIALLPCRKQEKIMKGIKTAVKTEWKNYVIKADADKARYHKVEYGKDNLNYVITATGLVPGKKYTFSARIRANIQETQCEKLFSFMGQGIGWFESNCQPISGKGDIDQFCAITVTPPRECEREDKLVYRRCCYASRMELRPSRRGLLYLRACDGERGRQATAIHRPGIDRVAAGERRAA